MTSWERSHDWLLIQFHYEYTKIAIQFQQDVPSVEELMTVRKCLPQFSHASPAQLRTSIIEAGGLFLEKMPITDAIPLIAGIRGAGLNVVEENTYYTSYLPVDRTTGKALLISDKITSKQVAAEMMAAGVPIKKIEEFSESDLKIV
jgi:hypothetical protein